METIEFVIYPDGRVEERVIGMVGGSCAQVTAAIEEKLGVLASQELTSEYFAHQSANNTQNNQISNLSSLESINRSSRW
jgi:Protein of unknown function (DUF2997)